MGRKLSFDVDEALEAAMRVFWEKGYDGASLEELTAAIGIRRPSLYNCFESKEALFSKVFVRYETTQLAFAWRALRQPSVRSVAAEYLQGFLQLTTDLHTPSGCLGTNCAIASAEDGGVRKIIDSRRRHYRNALLDRLARADLENDLPPGATPIALADCLLMVRDGIAIQARLGASEPYLRAAMDVVMTSLFQTRRSSRVIDETHAV